ncbi:MAG: amino acid adenylation domain-containing protein [bacterium]|nr:amino acid adenylation domain-containing protein [bacterium]
MTDLKTRLDRLSPEQRAQLLNKLRESRSDAPSRRDDAISQRPCAENPPLSFAQQRIWLHCQMNPGGVEYNIPSALKLFGELDELALQRSLNGLIQRHETLRTGFVMEGGLPVQSVLEHVSLPIRKTDWRGLHQADSLAALHDFIASEANIPFDLTQPPLFRVHLLRLKENESVLISTLHHIIADGWSMGLLLVEISELYRACRESTSPQLNELPIQYADFAVWQRERLQNGYFQKDVDYWKRLLKDVPPYFDFPSDRLDKANSTLQAARRTFHIPLNTTAKLKELARAGDATLFMAGLAVYAILISKMLDRNDIVIATAVANRTREELEPLIGDFVNNICIRVSLDSGASYEDILQRVRRSVMDAQSHEEMPFDLLIEEMNVPRHPNRIPYAQIGFALQTFSVPSLSLSGLEAEWMPVEAGAAKTDFSLFLEEANGALVGCIESKPEIFHQSTLEIIERDFQTILESVTTAPARPISDIGMHFDAKIPALSRSTELIEYETLADRSNLTRVQLLIWMGQKLNPDVSLYNNAMAITLNTKVDVEAFRRAFQRLIDSSDAIRTVFDENDGFPRQRVLEHLDYEMEFIDMMREPNPERAFDDWVDRRIRVVPDLTQCVFDSALVRLADDRYVWFYNFHHIVADGKSISQIFVYMASLYERESTGAEPQPIPLPRYRDYLDEERRLRQSSRSLKSAAFWEKRLQLETPPIPYYGKIPIRRGTEVVSLFHRIGPDRTRRILDRIEYGEIPGSTVNAGVYHFFTALLCTFLHRISGVDVVSFGTSFHNRSREFKDAIGLFMEVHPIRVELERGDTFVMLMRKIALDTTLVLKHHLYAVRNPKSKKVYDSMFTLQIMEFPPFDGKPIQAQRIHGRHEEDAFSFQVTDFEQRGDFTLEFEFALDVFPEPMRRLAVSQMLCLLDFFLNDLDCSVVDAPMTTETERNALLSEWSFGPVESFSDESIVDLFTRQAARVPGEFAVVDGSRKMTYAELETASNRVARRLREAGLSSESVVAVCMRKRLEWIPALLGVLKAGAAYLPLAAETPNQRLKWMLCDSNASFLIVDDETAAMLSMNELPLLNVDAEWEMLKQFSAEPLQIPVDPEQLAYIVYTSGSTGTPKGVMVEHRNAVNAYHGWRLAYQLEEDVQNHLQMANVSFDVFTGDVLRALGSGGSLVLCPREALLVPERLYQLLCEERIDCAEFVPAVLRELIAYLKRNGLTMPPLRCCIAGSDVWYVHEVRDFIQTSSPTTCWINSYGLSETAIDSTFFECEPSGWLPADWIVPIGAAFANVKTFILDRAMRLSPVGVPGELYIGGAGVSRGYLNRPDLTAERFIPDPFGPPGARLYKTGDMARFLPGGRIEFLGRLDNQIKIRGHRIEPAEIEAAIKSHPDIADAVVIAQKSSSPDRDSESARLIAYVVPRDSSAFEVDGLRTFLRGRLTDYMIPSAFIALQSLPLNANGKIDRNALPAPDSIKSPADEYKEPATEEERVLAGIWKELLNTERVSRHDDFFQLGGHSLLAAQLMNRIREAFNIDLPLRAVFEETRLNRLAERIKQIRSALAPSFASGTRVEGEI